MRNFTKKTRLIIFTIFISSLLTVVIYKLLELPLERLPASQFENLIIGHRGFRANYPENTMESFKQAYIAGAAGIEFDVQMTKDNIPIILHDKTIDRTTNGIGYANDLKYSEILKYNNLFGDLLTKEKIPTLSETLNFVKTNNLKADIELKETNNINKLISILSKKIKAKDLYSQVYVSSFHPTYLYKLRKIDPKIVTALNIGDFSKNRLINYFYDRIIAPRIAKFLKVSILAPNIKYLNNHLVNYYQKNGFVLTPYTVNNKNDKNFLKNLKLTYITDIPTY